MTTLPTVPLTLADFDFSLPPELIAQRPAATRSGSRLLDGRGAEACDCGIGDLPGLLRRGDLLVVNNTKVVKARLLGAKASGGSVEALVERVEAGHRVLAHLRASKSPKAGGRLRFADAFDAEVLGRTGPDESLFELQFPADPFELLERHGHVPLTPYIARGDDADDERRYQSVFAERPGAVAAPTAALHFDAGLVAALEARGVERCAVTLHVGAAAAAAIERARRRGGRIVAVGTTSLRALESAALVGSDEAASAPSDVFALRAASGETGLFITPGFEFRVVDLLLTNFHLPRSTLLMLVSAFAGHAHVLALYRHAIAERYRFFSYGDAMLLARGPVGPA